MIRMNNTGMTTVAQNISWNLKNRTCTHTVNYSNGNFNIYKRFELPDFATACVVYEMLETLTARPDELTHIEHTLDCIEANTLEKIVPIWTAAFPGKN